MKNNFIPGTLFYQRIYNELIIICASSLYEHQAIIWFDHNQILYTSVSTSYLTSCINLNNALIAESLHTD